MGLEVGKDYAAPSIDPSFMRALRSMDSQLGVKWIAKSRTPHWAITRMVPRPFRTALGGMHITTVEQIPMLVRHCTTPEGEYRAPGMYDLMQLGAFDLWAERAETKQAVDSAMTAHEREVADEAKAVDVGIQEASKDAASYLTRRHYS